MPDMAVSSRGGQIDLNIEYMSEYFNNPKGNWIAALVSVSVSIIKVCLFVCVCVFVFFNEKEGKKYLKLPLSKMSETLCVNGHVNYRTLS